MNSKPLQYESLKAVLMYMDANLRFKLSAHIRSIRKVEKIVPLKIDKLSFAEYQFTVNDVTYRFGTFRQYPTDSVPAEHLHENKRGGFQGDLDQFGNEDDASYDIITPGDLVFKDSMEHVPVYIPPIELGKQIEDNLEALELVLAQKLGEIVTREKMNRIFYRWESIYEELDAISVKEEIERQRVKLQPFLCRRDNVPLLFKRMNQLTIIKSERHHRIERKERTMRLFEFQKQLTTLFFGNRGNFIHVKRMEINHFDFIVRLPATLKIKLRVLKTYFNTDIVCDELQNVIHRTSYPLKQFETIRKKDNCLEHPLMKMSRKLVIGLNVRAQSQPWMQEFLRLTNESVHMESYEFTPDETVVLIQDWMDNHKAIGTSYTFGAVKEVQISETLDMIREKFHDSVSGAQVVQIPMSSVAQIKVSYVASPNLRYLFLAQWTMKIEVVSL